MINNKKIVAIIPARGGSKGIPKKNITDLCGKPLISYSIEEAKKSKYIDEVVVSTDDYEIKNISEKFGARVPFIRPANISNDLAKSLDVILYTLNYLIVNEKKEFYYCVLLQATSPLRTYEDIDCAIEYIENSKKQSLVSVCEVNENPVLIRTIENNKLNPIIKFDGKNLRRQDLPKYYIFNGAIYINKVTMLKEQKQFVNDDTLPFVMEQKKSIDIDKYFDLKVAELMIKYK